MERVRTTELAAQVGQRVWVSGWLNTLRRLGGITFLVIRDGWGIVQAVAEQEADLAPLTEAEAGVESVVTVEGTVTSSPQAPGGLELRDIVIEVIIPVKELPPPTLSKREIKAAQPTLLDRAVVSNRHVMRRALLRLGAAIMTGFRRTLDTRGFTEIQTPKIVASATESGANVFKLDYFGRPAYLAQSPQFYKQVMVGVFERVYEVGPVFRAEPHDTARHLNEYVSLDAEFGFIQDHFSVMTVLKDTIAEILVALQETCSTELGLLQVQMPAIPAQIPHIQFAEAQELIYRLSGLDERAEPDLSSQGERVLGEWAEQEYGSAWLFVIGYPMCKRPILICNGRATPTRLCSIKRHLTKKNGSSAALVKRQVQRYSAEHGKSHWCAIAFLRPFADAFIAPKWREIHETGASSILLSLPDQREMAGCLSGF